ncbi:MAG: hypothetical protein J6M55_00810 [Paludibacteraceae bacterium]|nr:hypothetical protein [Paludibacteraceae bacterium]
MKRIVIMLFVVASTLLATAQDVIFLGANDSIVAKVVSVGTSEITYKKWSNLEGPAYSISVNQIAAIRYANGTYDFFNSKNTSSQQETSSSANKMQLTRSGNTYYYGNQVMNKQATLEWLSTQNCPTAYAQFKQGLNLSKGGWFIMAIGLGLDLGGFIILGTQPENKTIGAILSGIGAAFEIACIPTIAVGYSKMHQTVNVYNVSCAATAQVKPYWSLQTSNNGIGLAYNF